MLYQIGLLCTVGLGLWVLADVAGARPRRFQALPTALLGGSCALWAGGEALIPLATRPEEILLGRRLLYLGTAVLPNSPAIHEKKAQEPGVPPDSLRS